MAGWGRPSTGREPGQSAHMSNVRSASALYSIRLLRRQLILAAAILLPAAAAIVPAARADRLVETIERIKPGVVGVGTYLEIRRPPSKLLGTGFAVADGRHFLTNNHVLPRLIDNRRREYYCIFVGTGHRVRIVSVKVVARDEAHDVAILRADASEAVPPLSLGDDTTAKEGMSIAFTGFPIGAVLGLYPVTHRGTISARTPIAIPQPDMKTLDLQMIKRLRGAFDVFQLDATAYPGNSGSPLYDIETGAVVGIVSSVFVKASKESVLSEPSGISYAIPIRHALALLRKHRIPVAR